MDLDNIGNYFNNNSTGLVWIFKFYGDKRRKMY